MAKFHWEPSRLELAAMVGSVFEHDGVGAAAVHALLEAFPRQPLDFFGAIRNRLYDGVRYYSIVTAMNKLRIVMLRFGTGRQRMVLERETNP